MFGYNKIRANKLKWITVHVVHWTSEKTDECYDTPNTRRREIAAKSNAGILGLIFQMGQKTICSRCYLMDFGGQDHKYDWSAGGIWAVACPL